MVYVLTEKGLEKVKNYIKQLEVRRKKILDAGRDTANDTELPTVEDIIADMQYIIPEIGEGLEYFNIWGVTDNHDFDAGLELHLDKDFVINIEVNKKTRRIYNYHPEYSSAKEVEIRNRELTKDKRTINNYRKCAACGDYLQKLVEQYYQNNTLNCECIIQDVLHKYYIRTVSFVLANAILQRTNDGRISKKNKQWANEINKIFKEEYPSSMTFSMLKTHSELLDFLVTYFREYIEREYN